MSLQTIRSNPIMLTDAYNLSHTRLKVNTDWEVSHLYNRKRGMILYGFSEVIASVLGTQITMAMVDEADEAAKRMGLIFPRELWERVVNECNGYLPIKVEALSEGSWCPVGAPFAQVSNTLLGFGELVTWLEPIFMHTYFPSSCATEAFHMRKYLEDEKTKYGFDDSFMWKIHSFGFRGHRSLEDAYLAGTAWNLFLHGTDDFHTSVHTPKAQIGSISALAHKVVQQFDSEIDCFYHTIDATEESGEKVVAMVIDTYNTDRVIYSYLPELALYAEEKGISLVMRPDSGDVINQAIDIWKVCKACNLKNVAVIIGEGMNFEQVKAYDRILKANNVPTSFVFYGVGGGFYNHIDRDYLGFAMKTAYSNGANRMKFSEVPIKRSIPGEVVIIHDQNDELVVCYEKDEWHRLNNKYKLVYYHDSSNKFNKPYIEVADWNKTKELANKQTGKQERIILSSEVIAEIERFERLYKGAN